MKKIVFAVALLFGATSFAQTIEELKAEKAKKDAEIAKLQGESGALKAKIDAFPGWKFGAFGTIGANFSGFNNWFQNAMPNSSTANIGVTVNGYANLDREKYFWRNSANINLGWLKIDNLDISTDSPKFEATTDVFNISSLYGYKVSKTIAISALGEYRTSIIKNFNNPGYLDLGVGATWTPIPELVVVVHPLNYNFVFAKDNPSFESSLGAKIVAQYAKTFFGRFNFKSNLSMFQSYKEARLSNYTWINSLGFNIWKGIGVGLEHGLRYNEQETPINPKAQTYWLVGLNYNLSF